MTGVGGQNQSGADPATPWWDREAHRDRQPFLRARNAMQRAIRRHFDDIGFLEVDTGCLQVSPGNETHLQAFETALAPAPGETTAAIPLYLHTSPEFACKKLLAAGEERLFTFAHAFRNGERSVRHAPEFMMLEWYEAARSFDDLLAQTEAIVGSAFAAIGAASATHRGQACEMAAPFERLTVSDAFARDAGIDLEQLLCGAPDDRDAFAEAATHAGQRVSDDDTWADIFSKIMTGAIEPNLGANRPTLLTHYPASEAALAQLAPGAPHLAERFELYICGVEIANGYAELTNAAVLAERFESAMDEMERRYGRRYPIDHDFLDATAVMPPAIGCALGFDRLVMLATGASDINKVIWTPLSLPREQVQP